MSIEIIVNSVFRGAIYVENTATPSLYTGSTGVALLIINQGDDCFIRTHHNPGGSIRSDYLMRTSFSGMKIG